MEILDELFCKHRKLYWRICAQCMRRCNCDYKFGKIVVLAPIGMSDDDIRRYFVSMGVFPEDEFDLNTFQVLDIRRPFDEEIERVLNGNNFNN